LGLLLFMPVGGQSCVATFVSYSCQ
jgi:hypothetical protein